MQRILLAACRVGYRFHPTQMPCQMSTRVPVDDAIALLPMPKLSHEMIDGWVSKWHVKEGQELQEYDVLCEVSTDTLAEEAYKVGDFAGTATLLVESQEEGYVHKLLLKEGQPVSVGTPIAIVGERPASGGGHTLRTTNVYDDQQQQVKVLAWQAYLKESKKPSGGCM